MNVDILTWLEIDNDGMKSDCVYISTQKLMY